jgi:hypothetical protein
VHEYGDTQDGKRCSVIYFGPHSASGSCCRERVTVFYYRHRTWSSRRPRPHAGEGCAGGETTLSGSLEGEVVAPSCDLGWYFEFAGMIPPFFFFYTVQNNEQMGKKKGRGKERTLSSNFTTVLLGRAAPFSSQYFIRSTLQCIVLCS